MDGSSQNIRSVKGLPLFMANHTITESRQVFPRAGIDFVYDDRAQKAAWLNPDSTNKWTPTAYSDSQVDGVDYIAVNFIAE